jgi:hypothetical protein
MNKDVVFLVAGDPLSLSTDIPEPWRQDVLISLLFSRLYANSKADKLFAAGQWYTNFSAAMEKVKWRREAYKGFSFEPGIDDVVVLRDLVKKKSEFLLGVNQKAQLERLMSCIEESLETEMTGAMLRKHAVANSPAENKSDFSTIALQLSFVGSGPVIYTVFVCFSTTEEVEVDFINQRFVGRRVVGKISVDVSKQVLDKSGYERARMREKLMDQLPDSIDEFIVDLAAEDS